MESQWSTGDAPVPLGRPVCHTIGEGLGDLSCGVLHTFAESVEVSCLQVRLCTALIRRTAADAYYSHRTPGPASREGW